MVVPALEVRALARRYRAWPAAPRDVLRGIDLALAPGEGLGLVGPNGSGKSTLLSILAGIERPSSGAVRVFGMPIEAREARRRVGYLPDGFPFPEELGPRALLDLVGALQGLARAEARRRGDELLARVALAAEARTPAARFSLGMKRRLALCLALVHRPDLLLLDEPSAGLDAPGYAVLEELLGEARARGASLLVVTHVVGDLEGRCERTGVLVGGRLVHLGPTSALAGSRERLLELYRQPAVPPCSA